MAKKKNANNNSSVVIILLVVLIVVLVAALLIIWFVNPGGSKEIVFRPIINIINGDNSTKDADNSGGNSQTNNNTGDNGNNGGNINPSTLAHGEGELQLHMLDTAQGDWLLLLLPDGKEMLIDAGSKPDPSSLYTTNKAYMDTYITDGQIDYVILTHSDQDHVAYMDEIFADYQVDNLYMPALFANPSNATLKSQVDALPAEKTAIITNSGVDSTKCSIETATYARFYIAAFTEPNCNIFLNLEINSDNDDTTLDANSKITSSDNTYSITFFFENLAFYNNKKFAGDGHQINGISPTMIVEYNGKRIVLTGDANQENEPYMVQRLQTYYGGVIDCDILKVAHHGSHEGSSNAYLDEVTCEYAICSCGTGNDYDHPRQVTLDRIKAHNMTLYRTDLHGAIVCKIDKDGNITITPTNTNVSSTDLWIGPA